MTLRDIIENQGIGISTIITIALFFIYKIAMEIVKRKQFKKSNGNNENLKDFFSVRITALETDIKEIKADYKELRKEILNLVKNLNMKGRK